MTTIPDTEPAPTGRKSGSVARTVIICAVILLAAGGLAALTFFTEPEAQRSGATKKTAMLVDVVTVERGTHRPQIVGTGTVEPARDIVLSPQVGGRVVAIAEEFTPGGYVEKGDVLVRLERADYRYALAQRKSELREALSQLADEKGLQGAARADYEYFGEKLSEESEALVLRKAQLAAAEERVAAARSAIEQAELDLERTSVEAPFDAHVLRRDVNVGSQVAPADPLGRLVGIETYWVAVELPLTKLRWISIPDAKGGEGAEVRIRNRQSWPKGAYRTGKLFRLVGALDSDTRMARVLAAVNDPLARGEELAERTPGLMVGEFVEVAIDGIPIENVVRLDRDYVRDNDTVWTMVDDKLHIKEVEVVLRDEEHAYVASGLESGDAVVTTNLSTVVDGAPLRVGEPRREGGE